MFLRRLTAIASTLAVALSGVVMAAAPAAAAATGASISESQWLVGTTKAVTVSWTETTSVDGVMVRSPWPWGASWVTDTTGFSATGGTTSGASVAQTITCTQNSVAIVFTISSAALTSQPTCKYENAQYWKGFWIEGGGLTVAAGATISVAIPIGQVTAPGTAQTDTWLLGKWGATGDLSNRNKFAFMVEVASTAYADPSAPPPPLDTLDFDGNGGTCSPDKKEGFRGTWSKALTAADCSKSGSTLKGFSTSPISAPGSVFVDPGGPIFFGGSNRLYAIWGSTNPPGAPTDVVAVAGRNKITVSWKAPADEGGYPITNYVAFGQPPSGACVTGVREANALSCTFNLRATNTKYAFTAQALNGYGWGASSALSNAVSPFDLLLGNVERNKSGFLDSLRGFGSTISLEGKAPGIEPGTPVTPEWKAGNGAWVSEASAGVKVGLGGGVSWSKKLKRSLNNTPVSVRFAIGSERSSESTVAVGASSGVPSPPRKVTVTSTVRGITISWDRPAKNGASAITGYEVTSSLPQFNCSTDSNTRSCTLRVREVDPKAVYNFSVTASNASGASRPGTASWSGQVWELRFREVSRRTVDAGAEVGLDVSSKGFPPGQNLVVEAQIGTNGPWRKQAGSLILGPSGFGSWTGIVAGAKRQDQVAVRVVSPHGTSSVVAFRGRG